MHGTGGQLWHSQFSLNPLNQVYVFNACSFDIETSSFYESCLNPLNQVYVFNSRTGEGFTNDEVPGLNPLNQVYVFNF